DRIIPDTLNKTELGRDLLAQDYILKQLTASLIYPEDELGKAFWARVYDQAFQKFGVTEIPVDTFNKVWILPETASVVEKGNTVYIAQAHLKVMLEADYLAQGKAQATPDLSMTEVSKQILREIIVPTIEKEVNEGANFASLRQVFYAMVLAQWYQDVFKKSVINKLYAGQGKVAGIDLSDPKNKQIIYDQYMAAYQKGVFNFVKEETDRLTNQPLPKKYFSGGWDGTGKIKRGPADMASVTAEHLQRVQVNLNTADNSAVSTVSKVFYEGKWEQVLNRELRVYLNNLQNPGTKKVVSDVSLEAFLDPIKGSAQLALGKGGLGFLTGETWGAYSDLENWKAMGAMPLYSYDKNGNEIDWDRQQGVEPVYVQDDAGRKSVLSFDVDFNGQKERVYIYWINTNEMPVFGIKHKTLFRKLYPGGDEQVKQYGFMGQAYAGLMNVLGVSPNILRLSEPQLIFVVAAVKNDIERHGNSVFNPTKIVMTTHTPERAALPSWDSVPWLKSLVGSDLVREDIIYASQVNAAGAMAHHAAMINGVSPEHKNITQVAVLSEAEAKTTGIQNGSEPYLWRSEALNDLVLEKGISKITGKELFDISVAQKQRLNEFLKEHGFETFDNMDRPLFGAVRRLVEYKSQAMFLPLMKWIVGDPDKDYETPLGLQKGLGANVLFGGEALDNVTPEWMKEFKELEQDPDVKGRFVMAERTTGTQFMQLATSASDGWLVMPWMTREASGTSDHRAGFNGHLVIATATGGPLEWVDHGVNGWLVTPFKFEHLKRNTEHAAEFRRIIWAFQNKEVWALTRFYEEGRRQFATYMKELVTMYHEPGRERLYTAMVGSFQAAHRRVSIHRMVQEYGLMFDAVWNGEGVADFEAKLDTFGRNWESKKSWQKEGRSIVFDLPQTGEAVSLLMTLDGYDPLNVSIARKDAEGGVFDLVTPTGTFPIKNGSDIYVIRSNNQLRAMPKPPAFGTAGMTRLRMQINGNMRINVVRSGTSQVKITVLDNAQAKKLVDGGIDLQNIAVDRQGELMAGIVSDKAIESMLLQSSGVRGVIMSITPIADIKALLR
ncbi:MAG: hypothetical protein HQL17_06125, partial [Candidatus Omnitrophica bacterium]|nr:hypothetical protein [Candidatus Omnitrophota bacterium]